MTRYIGRARRSSAGAALASPGVASVVRALVLTPVALLVAVLTLVATGDAPCVDAPPADRAAVAVGHDAPLLFGRASIAVVRAVFGRSTRQVARRLFELPSGCPDAVRVVVVAAPRATPRAAPEVAAVRRASSAPSRPAPLRAAPSRGPPRDA